jgi:arginase
MNTHDITLIGAPLDCGKRRLGCLMGPDAYRTAGLAGALGDLGHTVRDAGNVAPRSQSASASPPASAPASDSIYALPETIAWTEALADAAQSAMAKTVPIFMGGDHALSLGTVLGVARHGAQVQRPLFILWLDAHTDFHTPHTTSSGNLHGTPVGYLAGRDGFDGFPKFEHPVPHENICLIGLRSVDQAEREDMQNTAIRGFDMRAIDETGIAKPLAQFLNDVKAANGLLHVSLDVDFLDPSVAPAVGTTVPGGATVREAQLVMEMLHDSGLMTSLDLVELNPFLDERGRTAQLMVELTASAMGRKVFDRPTRAFD